MRLEYEGRQSVAAPIDAVWDRLIDAEFAGACAPGVTAVDTVGPDRYKALAKVSVGSLSLAFAMQLTLSELKPPTSATLRVTGSAPRSVLDATATVRLERDGRDATVLAWAVAADVKGAIAGTGARLLKGTGARLIGKFWQTFARRVEQELG